VTGTARKNTFGEPQIILPTANGLGTHEIMRRTGTSKVTVWRWQERFMRTGVAGLLRDKTRPSRTPPLPASVRERTVAHTLGDPPGEATHWTAEMMAKSVGISVSSVQRIWRTPIHPLRFAAALP
jgi:transposase